MGEKFLEHETIEQKVAQLFVVGLKRYTPSTELIQLLKNGVGGIIFFEQNILSIQQLNSLMVELQEFCRVPLIFSVDQEGGSIERIKGITSIPSHMALGALDNPKVTRQIADISAKELAYLGINCCFSPVLDVNTCAYNPVINTRSFGDQPDKVSLHAQCFIDAYKKQGIIPVGKHFPGHGASFTDSHFDLPIIDCSLDDFNNIHLKPFKEAINNGLNAVMVCHALFTAIEKDKYIPASLSRNFSKGILREKWGYEGLIISDDMVMGAISKSYDPNISALAALVAGVDMLIYRECNETVASVYRYLVESVQNGSLPEFIIDQAYQRVMAMKHQYGLFDKKINMIETNHVPSSKNHIETIKYAIQRSITIVKDPDNKLPLSHEEDILIMAPDKNVIPHYMTDYPGITVGYFLQQELTRVTEIFYNPTGLEEEIMTHLPYASKFHTVIFLSYNGCLLPSQMKFLNSMPIGINVICIAVESPYDALFAERADALLLTYGYRSSVIEALAKILLGYGQCEGKAPVLLTGETQGLDKLK